ncbi:PH domain-containing protein [Haloplanus sp. GCM10025708]
MLLIVFGLFVFGVGLYVHFVAAPEAPRMRENEAVVDERDPAQRNALAEAFVSVPFLGVGGYLLYFTQTPLVYPTAVLALGLYLFSRGVHRYWRNTLTTYFVTNQRVIEEYRFISLIRNEVPHEKVRAVEERRSAWDSLFGLGNVAVRSGASGDLTVSVDEVYDPAEFADVVRDEIRAHDGTGGGASTDSAGETSGDSDESTGDSNEASGESEGDASGDSDETSGEPGSDGPESRRTE